MSEWKEVRLSDICSIEKQTINPNKYEDETFYHFSLPAFDNFKTPEIQKGIEIKSNKNIVSEGTILYNKLNIRFRRIWNITFEVMSNSVCSTEFLPIKPKKTCNQNFLYYLLWSDEITNKMQLGTTGTSNSHQRISPEFLLDTIILMPSLHEQEAIAETLSSIDEMIELNNRNIKVLEEMSQALYKSWFVDFDFPNQEGKPYKLSGGEMVESEIGLIPKGWKIAELGDVTTNLREKTKSNDYKVLSAVNTGNLMLSEDYFTKQVFSKDLSKYIIVKQKDFAYNPARVNIGSIGMNEFDFDGCVSPVYVAFRPEEGYHWFFHIYVKSNNFNDEVNKRASGSVRQALNYGDFALIKIAYPPKSVIDKFNDFYEEAYLSQKEIKQETQTLINLRDTLLPKLMSGELMVPCEEEI